MTLTDELCVRLNELGVEHTTYTTIVDEAVIWTGSVCNWIALPSEYGLAVAVYKDYLTPEQAIAATVGRSCASCPEMDNPDSYIVHLHRALEVADKGAGTCHFKVVIDQDPSRRGRGNICECDKCGYRCARGFIEDERFKYCPNCGKRIVKEYE